MKLKSANATRTVPNGAGSAVDGVTYIPDDSLQHFECLKRLIKQEIETTIIRDK